MVISGRAPMEAHTLVAAAGVEEAVVVAGMPFSITSPRLPIRSFLAAAARPKV